jgi:TonB family protein
VRRTIVAFILSLIVHPLAFGALLLLSKLTATERPPRVQSRPVALRTISQREWDAARGRRNEPLPRGQVVDVAPGNRVRPKETKYLAEDDNKVEKQTKAKDQRSKYSVAAAKTTENPEALPSLKGRTSVAEPVNLTSQLEAMTEAGRRPKLGPLLSAAMTAADEHAGETPSIGDEARGAATDVPATGGAAPNDDLREQTGDGTYLNTKEFKFAAFMNRVKQAVSAKWDPNGRVKAKDPGGKYQTDRYTVLVVTLRADGSIAEVYVERSCGLDWLDMEAMGAFERAAPFPNVPPGILQNGYVRFQFGFTLTYTNGFMPRF